MSLISLPFQPIPAPIPVPVPAIVLAGGLSSRMGQDKALITVDGLPLLLLVCQVAQQVAAQVYVVTSWVERYRDLSAEANITLIPEPLLDVPPGPLCGFLEGLSQIEKLLQMESQQAQNLVQNLAQNNQIQPEWVLLLACDLPNLRPEVLQAWRLLLAETPPEVMALLPQSAGRWEPLCGFYRWHCQTSLRAFAKAGGRSFQSWLSQQVVQPLPVNDPTMLLNCNRPADLQQIKLP